MQAKRWGEWITDSYIALLLAVFPFYVAGDYTTLSGGKYRLFLVLCGSYIVMMTAISLWDRAWRRRMTAAEGCAVGYLLLTMLSALASEYLGVWLGNSRYEGALTIAIYVLCFLFVSRYGRSKPWQLWLLGVSIGGYALICLMQLAGGNPLGLYPSGVDYADGGIAYTGAFLGTMGNAGLSGAWLSLGIPVLFGALFCGKGKMRWLLAAPLLLGVLVVGGMDISAAMLGVGGSLLLSLPVVLPRSWRRKASVAVAAVLVCAFAALWLWPFFSGTAGEIHLLLRGVVDDGFGSGRIGIWRQLLARVPEYWLFGSGPDTVGVLGLAPFVAESADGEIIRRSVDVAHNEYLHILICQGAAALAAYLGLLLTLCRGWMKSSSTAVHILGCGVLGYCIQAFFSFSMCITAPLFWLALGLLCSEIGKEPSQKETVLFV